MGMFEGLVSCIGGAHGVSSRRKASAQAGGSGSDARSACPSVPVLAVAVDWVGRLTDAGQVFHVERGWRRRGPMGYGRDQLASSATHQWPQAREASVD